MQTQSFDQLCRHLAKLAQLRFPHARILPRRAHDTIGVVENRDRDKTLCLERGEMTSNLPFTQIEEVGEVTVRGVATPLIVEGMDFDEEHFFHE